MTGILSYLLIYLQAYGGGALTGKKKSAPGDGARAGVVLSRVTPFLNRKNVIDAERHCACQCGGKYGMLSAPCQRGADDPFMVAVLYDAIHNRAVWSNDSSHRSIPSCCLDT